MCSFSSCVHSVHVFIQLMCSFSSCVHSVHVPGWFWPELCQSFCLFVSFFYLNYLPVCSVDYLPAWTLSVYWFLWITCQTIVYSGLLFKDSSVELLQIRLFLFIVVPLYLQVIFGAVPGSLHFLQKKSVLGPAWVSFEHRHDTLETNLDKRIPTRPTPM